MGYFDADHDVAVEGTAGGSVGFLDNVQQGFEQQFRVDSPMALREELDNRWKDSLRLLEAATGEKQAAPWGEAITDYARMASGEQVGEPVGLPPQALEMYRKQIAQLKQTDERIKALGDPNIADFTSIVQDVVKMQRETEQQTNEYSERSGVLGDIGQFIGAIGGSFTTRDPVSLFSLPLGGEGRTIAMRIGSEMAIGAAGVAATIPDVNVGREFAGLPERNPMYEIAAGAIGAGLLRGAFEGGAKVFKHLRGVEKLERDFEDAQLRSMFEARPESPRARAGLELLDEHAALKAASPYGDSDAGLLRFTAELSDVARVVGGQADTAIVRFLPEIPFEFVEQNLDFQLVKAEAPEVYGRLEVAQAKLAEVDGRVTELQTAVDNPSLVDAVERIDEASGGLVRSFAEDMQNPMLTAKQRADAEIRVTQIIESLGPELVDRTLRDMQIVPRQELKRARQERKAANRRYKDAYKAVEVEVGKIRTREAILKGVKPQPVSILDYSPVLGDSMRHDVVQARATAVAEVAEAAPERAINLVEDDMPFKEKATQTGEATQKIPTKTVRAYHGTGPVAFTEWDLSKAATGYGGEKGVFYFAEDPKVAELYASTAAGRSMSFEEGVAHTAHVNKLYDDLYEALVGDDLRTFEEAFPLGEPVTKAEILDELPPEIPAKLPKGFLDQFIEAWNKSSIEPEENSGVIRPVDIDISNFHEVDMKGDIYKTHKYEEAVAEAKALGKDGVIIRNVIDAPFQEDAFTPSTVYAVFDPNVHTKPGLGKFEQPFIDIGLEQPVDANLIYPITMEDGSLVMMSVRDMMKDLNEDRALEEAMRICSL